MEYVTYHEGNAIWKKSDVTGSKMYKEERKKERESKKKKYRLYQNKIVNLNQTSKRDRKE